MHDPTTYGLVPSQENVSNIIHEPTYGLVTSQMNVSTIMHESTYVSTKRI